jgi:hypothetical protein
VPTTMARVSAMVQHRFCLKMAQYNNRCNIDFVEKWHINNSFGEVQFCNLRYVPENLCTKILSIWKGALCFTGFKRELSFNPG